MHETPQQLETKENAEYLRVLNGLMKAKNRYSIRK